MSKEVETSSGVNPKMVGGFVLVFIINAIIAYLWASSNAKTAGPGYSVGGGAIKAFMLVFLIEAVISGFLAFVFKTDPFIMIVFGGQLIGAFAKLVGALAGVKF